MDLVIGGRIILKWCSGGWLWSVCDWIGWDQMTISWDCDAEILVYVKAGESWPSEPVSFSHDA
jgi:hypothetical protein